MDRMNREYREGDVVQDGPLKGFTVASVYTAEQAYHDGLFMKLDWPAGWFMTTNLYRRLEDVCAKTGAEPAAVVRRLVSDAVKVVLDALGKDPDESLVTDWRSAGYEGDADKVWIGRNESGGWTLMLPSDY